MGVSQSSERVQRVERGSRAERLARRAYRRPLRVLSSDAGGVSEDEPRYDPRATCELEDKQGDRVSASDLTVLVTSIGSKCFSPQFLPSVNSVVQIRRGKLDAQKFFKEFIERKEFFSRSRRFASEPFRRVSGVSVEASSSWDAADVRACASRGNEERSSVGGTRPRKRGRNVK
ncbi:uncharacterized protein LOC143182059 [Calliopsis andreniformis]|uniref:uncharacterized protein LOC143182059 n=1 Tax=Calliopsis andreniformis TaxID=337506 RepID=UPI003FCD9486